MLEGDFNLGEERFLQLEDKRIEYEEHKKNLRRLFPLLFCCGFLFIIAVTFITVVSKNLPQKDGSSLDVIKVDDVIKLDEDKQILAVLKAINTVEGTITLLDIENGEDITLHYTGGTNLIDKYEQVIAIAQFNIGEMVDAYYNVENEKLVKLQISNLAWEYQSVDNWNIDQTNKIIEIVDSKYKYSQTLMLVRQDQFLELADLNEKDQLTIKGYEREIWSILVTKGHGTLKLEDYDDFIGGMAYFGNEDILPVVSDMVITVQEGIYDVTLENGSLKGTKQVKVEANKDVVVNMGEFRKPVVQMGLLDISITPDGADLFIDDLLQSYENLVEIEYGEHTIKVSVGGYTTYIGSVEIDEASKTLSIDLVEAQVSENLTDTDIGTDAQDNYEESDNNNLNQTDDANDNSEEKNESPSKSGEIDSENNIYIQQPEGASAYFNGEFKGSIPLSFPKEIGTHFITLIKTDYQTKTYTIEVVDDGEDVNFSFPDMAESE